jgi:hypothetical protein
VLILSLFKKNKQKMEIPIRHLAENSTATATAAILIDHFGVMAYDVAVFIKAQIPMYTGNLNPVWKFWDDVVNYTCTRDKTPATGA